MTLRQSETLLRLLVGLALGFGFLGFATHGRATLGAQDLQAPSALLGSVSPGLAR